jgi:hypothetical protein
MHWDHEPLRLTEARSGARVGDPQQDRFMESLAPPNRTAPLRAAGSFRAQNPRSLADAIRAMLDQY